VALPLKSFPANISATEQARIKTKCWTAIAKDSAARLPALCAFP